MFQYNVTILYKSLGNQVISNPINFRGQEHSVFLISLHELACFFGFTIISNRNFVIVFRHSFAIKSGYSANDYRRDLHIGDF